MKQIKLSAVLALFAAVLFSLNTAFASSPRMVLVEEMTQASCPPCASANPAFHAYLEENLDKVIPLIYHPSYPGRDDMYSENPQMHGGRTSYYGNPGVPATAINGGTTIHPGNLGTVEQQVNSYQGQTSPITIEIEETKNGNDVDISVTVSSDEAINGKTLRIAATEFYHYYENAGTNGEVDFPWIAREMFPSFQGETINIAAGGSQTFEHSYTIKGTWNADQMYIVAFIQDDGNKEVLQAASSLKLVSVNSVVNNPFLNIDPSGEVTGTVRFENPNDFAMEIDIELDTENSMMPSEVWDVTLSKSEAALDAGAYVDVDVTFSVGDAAGFAQAAVKATPKNAEGVLKSNTGYVYALSSKTKYAFYFGTNTDIYPVINTYMGLAGYSPESALLPFNIDVFQAYPVDNFDIVMFSFDHNNRGILGGFSNYSAYNAALINMIEDALDAGKGVLITGEAEAAIAFSDNGSQMAKNFFTQTLGVQSQGVYTWVNNNQLSQFSVKGFPDDDISNGMSINCHDGYSQQYPYYAYWGDVLTVSAGDATGYLYYLNDQTKIAAARREVGNGRIIYQGFGFEVIGNNQNRATLMKKSLDWLMGESTSAGVLSLASDMVDFGSVQVGESSVESIRAANTGTGALTINSIDIISDDGGVFTVTNSDELPKTIAPSTIWDITIMFEPDAAGDFSGTVRINSDAGTKEATINGVGEAGSVKDGVYGIDGIFTMKAGPNPFTDYTTITYNVGGLSADNVQLNVIDASGRVVSELVNKTQAPGEYTIDLNGAELASGTYYVIARVGEMTERMPVVLTK